MSINKLLSLTAVAFAICISVALPCNARAVNTKEVDDKVGNSKYGLVDGYFSQAEFKNPTSAVNVDGYIYVTDTGNHCIRMVDIGARKVSSFTGGALNTKNSEELRGYMDSTKSMAQFNEPTGITADDEGTLYVADTGNNVIRMIKDGMVSTLAGNGKVGYSDGRGVDAQFNAPRDVFIMNNELYVADSMNGAVRRVSKSGSVRTIVKANGLIKPVGLYGYEGSLYIADEGAHAIFVYTPSRGLELLAGGGSRMDEQLGYKVFGNTNGVSEKARFSFPCSVLADKNKIYIVDKWNSSVKLLYKGYVSTYMNLRYPSFVAKPTKMLTVDNKIMLVDSINNQLLFYLND